MSYGRDRTETRLGSFAGSTLDVVQPSIWKNVHELRDHDRRVATLTFKNLLGFEATGTCDEGSWTIGQKGMWKPKVIVREAATGNQVTDVPVHLFKQTFTFSLPRREHETLTISRNFWATRFTLTGRMGWELLTLTTKPFSFSSGTFTVREKAGSYDEIPWLLFIVWYFSLTIRRSSAHAH